MFTLDHDANVSFVKKVHRKKNSQRHKLYLAINVKYLRFFKMAAKTIKYFTIFNSIQAVMTILMLMSTFLAQGYIRSMRKGKNIFLLLLL